MIAAPLLRTERLELWGPQASDLPGLVELIAAEETRRYLGPAMPEARSQFERLTRNAGSWSLYGYGAFYARLPGAADIVASCGVFHTWRGLGEAMDDVPEAGWIVRHDHVGQGYASEAMHAVLAWFDATHGQRRITAMIEDGNVASQKLAARLGFVAFDRQEFEGELLSLYERLP